MLASAEEAQLLPDKYESLPYVDTAIEIVYRSRLAELEPGRASERGIISTILRSPIELWYFYSISYTKAGLENENVVRITNDYFGQVAKAIVNRKQGMREFLMMSRFADGELATELSDWNGFLAEHDERGFARALSTLDAEGQRRICGDCEEFKHSQ